VTHGSLGSNGFTKFLESMLSLVPFQKVDPTLVLECYEPLYVLLSFKLSNFGLQPQPLPYLEVIKTIPLLVKMFLSHISTTSYLT
jgi:hypothetical protein